MEKIKTIVLILLVAGSLVQSYVLAYSSPKFAKVNQTDYVESEVIGTQAGLADVLFPDQIILHFGDNTHTLLRPNQQFYHMIYDEFLKQRTFDQLKRTSINALDINWNVIGSQNQGIELRFKQGIPLHLIQNIMQIDVDPQLPDDMITSIWIYVINLNDATESVRAFLFTDSNSVVFEATKPDISAKNVENFVGLGKYLTAYQSVDGDYYLPIDSIEVPTLTVPYKEFTPDQLKRSLFVDPSMTFYITKQDGTQIYTDGKKVLQVAGDKHWMEFSDPISAPIGSKNDIKENLLSAIQFINQHGGWNGSYVYSDSHMQNQDSDTQTIEFRQYMNDYPIFGSKADNFGMIKVILQNGVISGYERSMLNLDSAKVVRSYGTLPGGSVLEGLLSHYPQVNQIVSVFAGYQEIVASAVEVELIPRWIVQLQDGSYDFL